MEINLFEKLHGEGVISDSSFQKIQIRKNNQLLSVHWELKTLLYTGVLLLCSGLGILVYKNIDTIGHQAILAFIACTSIGCYYYCFKKGKPFSTGRVAAPNTFYDYILLLGSLTFVTFIGYLQFQYRAFGDLFGLATFIPMIVLFFTAYYFDHLGILSLAVTNLAAWAGIAITPAKILKENDFNDNTIIITGLLLGVFLILTGIISVKRKIKPHFEFTYSNFGTHILFISCLAAMFNFSGTYFLWFIFLLGIAYFFYTKSIAEKSFYYMLLLTLYLYIGLSYVVMRLLFFYQ